MTVPKQTWSLLRAKCSCGLVQETFWALWDGVARQGYTACPVLLACWEGGLHAHTCGLSHTQQMHTNPLDAFR